MFQASPTSFFGTTPLAVLFPNLRLFDACCFYATPWFSFFLIRSDKNGLFTNGHRVCKMAVKTLLPVTLQSADRFSIVFIVDSKFYNTLVFLRSQLILSMSLHYTTLHRKCLVLSNCLLYIICIRNFCAVVTLWLNVLLSFETNSVDNAYTLCYGSSAEWFRYCDSALQFVHGLVHCRQIELHGDSYLKLADGWFALDQFSYLSLLTVVYSSSL